MIPLKVLRKRRFRKRKSPFLIFTVTYDFVTKLNKNFSMHTNQLAIILKARLWFRDSSEVQVARPWATIWIPWQDTTIHMGFLCYTCIYFVYADVFICCTSWMPVSGWLGKKDFQLKPNTKPESYTSHKFFSPDFEARLSILIAWEVLGGKKYKWYRGLGNFL